MPVKFRALALALDWWTRTRCLPSSPPFLTRKKVVKEGRIYWVSTCQYRATGTSGEDVYVEESVTGRENICSRMCGAQVVKASGGTCRGCFCDPAACWSR